MKPIHYCISEVWLEEKVMAYARHGVYTYPTKLSLPKESIISVIRVNTEQLLAMMQ
jgi:hypothetical protein